MWFLKTPTPTKYWAQQSIVSFWCGITKNIFYLRRWEGWGGEETQETLMFNVFNFVKWTTKKAMVCECCWDCLNPGSLLSDEMLKARKEETEGANWVNCWHVTFGTLIWWKSEIMAKQIWHALLWLPRNDLHHLELYQTGPWIAARQVYLSSFWKVLAVTELIFVASPWVKDYINCAFCFTEPFQIALFCPDREYVCDWGLPGRQCHISQEWGGILRGL